MLAVFVNTTNLVSYIETIDTAEDHETVELPSTRQNDHVDPCLVMAADTAFRGSLRYQLKVYRGNFLIRTSRRAVFTVAVILGS